MSRRKAKAFSNVQYSPLEGLNGGEEFSDAQFRGTVSSIPWKAIILAVVLFAGGTTLLIIGSCIVAGAIDSKYQDRMWPIIILGSLMFIPGAYHVRLAYYAYHRVNGYSFEDIPEFD